jgi:predicted alpha/beta superfamily hydrolase
MLVTTYAAASDPRTPEKPTELPLDSKILGEARTLVVTLPVGYEEGAAEYPVLYHLDAGTAGDALLAPARDAFPEVITVGIVNTDRGRDMFPVYVGPRRPTSGGAENFLGFLTTEVIPLIDQNYRTSGERILFGMSNSALFTVYALLKQPETFAAYIASSPMIGWCFDYIYEQAESFVQSEEPANALLFMIYGDDDSSRVVDAVPPFVNVLESRPRPGLRWEVVVIEDGGHVPPESLLRGLEAYHSPRPR